MSEVTRIFLVRHGDVEEKYHEVFGGRLEMRLSEKGKAQAEALGDFFRGKRIDAFYCSPMIRTRETFAPIGRACGVEEPVIEEGFREVDFGDWTGKTWREVEKEYQMEAHVWLEWLTEGLIPNAEPIADYEARISSALYQMIEREKGRKVLVVCHGGVIRMMLSLMLNLPMREMGAFEIEYGSVSVIDFRNPGTKARLISHAPWREL